MQNYRGVGKKSSGGLEKIYHGSQNFQDELEKNFGAAELFSGTSVGVVIELFWAN